MKPATKLKLTKRNAAAIDKYATLVRLTPEKFLNGFLKPFLTDFWDDVHDNPKAEEYSGQFRFKDRATAERPAVGMLNRFNKKGFGPEASFEVQVIESPRGRFGVVATIFSRGLIYQIPG
jgi:hypothetical protein